ncbi:MAG: DUF4261 domain-containing protein [Ruminococcus sp.]|nr:DUF4261 domain-containing protein [Ruminococcus sp.]
MPTPPDPQPVFTQNLSGEPSRIGGPFLIHLFFEEKVPLPERDLMTEVMNRRLGETELVSHAVKTAGFAVKGYTARYKDVALPPMLTVTDSDAITDTAPDAFTVSQMWDCPDKEQILARCKYKAVALDMMSDGLRYKERADMLMDFTEALLEMYPQCRAVMFESSGKMFGRKDYLSRNIPRESRFVYNAVNVRFFNIQGTEDMMVDTLGMSVLGLPDLQYHFHGADPDHIVNHAYNFLSYIYSRNCPINSGETVDGMENGVFTPSVQWKCQFEDALIQPVRPVIDVNMGVLASGGRK